jgi:hypothetical protein
MLKAAPKNIHIYLESNPNPNSLKFVVNEMLVPEGMSFDFPDAASAEEAPLAKELFEYPFVERVFYMNNFVTVTKNEDSEWLEIQDSLKKHIQSFLESGKLILDVKVPASATGEEGGNGNHKKNKNNPGRIHPARGGTRRRRHYLPLLRQ